MPDTRTLLVAGSASHVGKSTIATGLCRLLADRGVAVAPFKAQNMSNNAQVALTPTGEWGEIGVSQFLQARAARIPPHTNCNPVLLKPRGNGESQLIIDGEAIGHVQAGSYYDAHWHDARDAAEAAYHRLAESAEVIIAEGAGSIAEINLHHRDLANIETARCADADILVVVDIERGGAFAALHGTLSLMPSDLRDRVIGAVITKFRGDADILTPGITAIEERTGVPIVGVLPYTDTGLPPEDSVSIPATGIIRGDDDGESVTIGVVRLPRISNATDFHPLEQEPGVRVQYLPIDEPITDVDALILPGTKNTVDDLAALRSSGLEPHIRAFDGPMIGICGGYQMLGERLLNAQYEGTTSTNELKGIGCLPVETRFLATKHVEQVTYDIGAIECFGGRSCCVAGYEIHTGETSVIEPTPQPIGPESAARNGVVGTYLHGLFENDDLRDGFVQHVFDRAALDRPHEETVTNPYESSAQLLADHLDLEVLGLT